MIPKFLILCLFCLASSVLSQSHDLVYCGSWRLSVETNNAGNWTTIPERCYEYVKEYMNGDRYLSDISVVAENALKYAKMVHIVGDGKDAWIFDVDDTLLSFLRGYQTYGFGAQAQNKKGFRRWALRGKVPALQSCLRLYKEIQRLGFSIFILTGRPETLRNVTESNLWYAGYDHWQRLLLRNSTDLSKSATEYKSEKRKELQDEGYRIHGSSGDQWSDLRGFAMAERSFKVPNPTYAVT
ncbi:acid phosphatase 1-like [Amaranthus tricolor]|uniref:acid phosphatase 1-like n=1 Tax=Amaranthus tricolor TaxID=29722 RepID=UPI002586CD87|nr:acid phosphatase 1-like [Amaranthus tricolor]